jgi:hypothetical protein
MDFCRFCQSAKNNPPHLLNNRAEVADPTWGNARKYASHEASNEEMLGQAITLLDIAGEIDRDLS